MNIGIMAMMQEVIDRQNAEQQQMMDEIRRLRTENDTLRAERKTLWKQVPADEGTMMTYAAVHVVRWRPEFGEPACGFIQADREDGDA